MQMLRCEAGPGRDGDAAPASCCCSPIRASRRPCSDNIVSSKSLFSPLGKPLFCCRQVQARSAHAQVRHLRHAERWAASEQPLSAQRGATPGRGLDHVPALLETLQKPVPTSGSEGHPVTHRHPGRAESLWCKVLRGEVRNDSITAGFAGSGC